MKKALLRLILFIISTSLVIAGCGRINMTSDNKSTTGKSSSNKSTTDKSSSSLTIYPARVELPIGQKVSLSVYKLGEPTDNKSMEWSSSDTDIVKVTEDGTITAISEGEATIEAVQSEEEKAVCKVIVISDGPMLFYTVETEKQEIPDEFFEDPDPSVIMPGGRSDGGNGDDEDPEPPGEETETGSESETDDGIPVEHDPEIDIPVEVDPKIDEYVWTIRVNDKIEDEYPGMKMKLIYMLDLVATKEGGKNAYGVYKGKATLTMKVDASEYTKYVSEESEFNIFHGLNIDVDGTDDNLSIDVRPYDATIMKHYNGGPPLASLTASGRIPGWKMALGEMYLKGTLDLNSIVYDTSKGTGEIEKQYGSEGQVIYKMFVDGGGNAYVRIPRLTRKDDPFKGKITKRPYIPD